MAGSQPEKEEAEAALAAGVAAVRNSVAGDGREGTLAGPGKKRAREEAAPVGPRAKESKYLADDDDTAFLPLRVGPVLEDDDMDFSEKARAERKRRREELEPAE